VTRKLVLGFGGRPVLAVEIGRDRGERTPSGIPRPSVHSTEEYPEESMTVVNAPARSGSVAVIRRRLARPVDSSMLAAFRMAFGAVVAWELWRYFRLDRRRSTSSSLR
jgi:hypothetical protein